MLLYFFVKFQTQIQIIHLVWMSRLWDEPVAKLNSATVESGKTPSTTAWCVVSTLVVVAEVIVVTVVDVDIVAAASRLNIPNVITPPPSICGRKNCDSLLPVKSSLRPEPDCRLRTPSNSFWSARLNCLGSDSGSWIGLWLIWIGDSWLDSDWATKFCFDFVEVVLDRFLMIVSPSAVTIFFGHRFNFVCLIKPLR